MWAIRRSSISIKSQAFPSVTFRACCSKFETASSGYTDSNGLGEPPPHISDKPLLVKRFSSRAHDGQSSLFGKCSFSSQAVSGDLKEGFFCLDASNGDVGQEKNAENESDDESISESEGEEEDLSEKEEEAVENSRQPRRASLGLFKAVVDSPSMPVQKALDKWLEKGNDLTRSEISSAMFEFRRRKMYGKALQLSEWLESQETIEFSERDYASRVDLIAKIRGLQKAETHIEKIPESFRGEIVYRTLLANCVLSGHTKKAEQIFNKMKTLKLPLTPFTCNQLLLLYKRTDKRKIADVLLLMEKQNIKPSLFTYRILIETKGQSNDMAGMEQILETMKADGLQPDLRMQAVLARHYVYGGIKEKAKTILKLMEGNGLKENRGVCASLLPLYALLESPHDVKRVWEACGPDPRVEECMNAIDAWGKLKNVEEAEGVFVHMTKKWKKLSAKQYTSMLKVYANNKMLAKGKNLVKEMEESGCRMGPATWDALVKLFIEAGEFEKADLVLNDAAQKVRMKPLFATYMMVLDEHANRADVDNAEKIFHRMRQDGYVSRFRQYSSLLQAYVNAKVPAYGFRERMKADNVFPTKSLGAQLAEVDAFKKTSVSNLLD